MYFHTNLEYLLKKKGLTNKKFGSMINKTGSTVGDYISNRSNPTFDGLIFMAKFFEIKIDDLIFIDLTVKEFNLVEESSEKYHTNKIKTHPCFLTGDKCIFNTIDEQRKEIEHLKEVLQTYQKTSK